MSAVARLAHKAFSTLQARAALLGFCLTRIEDDSGHEVFIVSRGAYWRELETPESVEAWLARAGAPVGCT
jgi:hypothetical protein